MFLSDESAYSGGSLEIQGFAESSEFRLPAGHVLIYPSSSIHRVNHITEGVRYVCVGWIESYIKSAEDRALLFGMDAGARGLLARYGRSDELDLIFRLTPMPYVVCLIKFVSNESCWLSAIAALPFVLP